MPRGFALLLLVVLGLAGCGMNEPKPIETPNIPSSTRTMPGGAPAATSTPAPPPS